MLRFACNKRGDFCFIEAVCLTQNVFPDIYSKRIGAAIIDITKQSEGISETCRRVRHVAERVLGVRRWMVSFDVVADRLINDSGAKSVFYISNHKGPRAVCDAP